MGSFTFVACVALLVGASVASQTGFKEGQEYEYQYVAKAVSGLPNLKNQFAGVVLSGQVHVQRPNAQTVLMQIKRLRATEVNGRMPTGNTEDVLKDLHKNGADNTMQQSTELTEAIKGLRETVQIQYQDGKVQGFQVSREVPEYGVNLQKAIMSMMNLELDAPEAQNNANPEQLNELTKQGQDAFVNFVTQEEDVAGRCESTYSISSQNYEANPTESVLNVTKIRNYKNCELRPMFIFQSVQEQDCQHCDASNPEVLSHIAVMQYNLRGSRSAFEFERIESQGQMLYTPYTSEADVYLTNTSRVLVLRHKQAIQAQLNGPRDPKDYQSLIFKFPHGQRNAAEQMNEQFDARKAPHTPFYQGHENKVSVNEVAELIKNIAAETQNIENQDQSNVLAKALTAKKLMRTLNYEQIENVYQQCANANSGNNGHNAAKRVAHDVMVMAGTGPAILVLKKLIETDQIKGEEAALVLQQIPTTMLTPHYTIIEEFKKLIKSSPAQRNSQIYGTALLSFGTMVGIACNGTGNTRETPSYVQENAYCPEEIKQRFLNELAEELEGANEHWRKIVAVLAIGNTLAPEATEILKPYISGQKTDCPVLRSKAIYALNGAAKLRPHKVLRTLAPVFFNTEEMPEIRAAALSMLISARPSHQFLARVAASTWNEPSQQIGSFVHSTLENLAQADAPCLHDLKNNAKQALELANQDFSGNVLDSKNIIIDDDKMKKYNIFNTFQASWIRSNESALPTEMFAKINRTASGFNYQPVAVNLNMKGVDEVINRIMGPKSAFYKFENINDLFKSEDMEAHKGFNHLVKALNIDTESRKTSDFMINMYVKFMDTQARNFHISKQTIKNFLEGNTECAAAKYFAELVFGPGLNLNYQKIFNQRERLVQLPSAVGLSIVIKENNPVLFHVRGHINVEINSARNPNSVIPTEVSVSAKAHPVLAQKKLTTMGVLLPFNQKIAAAGASCKILLSFPLNGEVKFDLAEGKIIAATRHSSEHGQENLNSDNLPIFRFKVQPFTTIAEYLKPMPINQQHNKKDIKTEKSKQTEMIRGEEALGLPIVIKTTTEENDMTSCGAFVDKVLQNGAWNLLNMWNRPRSLKAREYSVYLKTKSANAKSIEADLDFDFTPSKLQRGLTAGQYTPNSVWSFVSGWSDMPMPCKPSHELTNENQKDDEEYQRDYNQDNDDDEEDNEGNDNGYDDNENRQVRRKAILTKSMKKRFWNEWKDQSESDSNENDFDEAEGSYEYNAQNNKQRQGKHHQTVRASRYNSNANSRLQGSMNNAENSNNYGSDERSGNVQIENVRLDDNIQEFKVKLNVRAVGGAQRSLSAEVRGKRNYAELLDTLKIKINIQNPKVNGNQLQVCAEASAKYPAKPCSYDNAFNPRSVGPIKANAKITWGQQCNEQNFVEVNAIASKSAKQLQAEHEGRPWYYKQCMQERSKGLKFNEACSRLYDEVTSLKKINIRMNYNNVPAALVNATNKVDDALKYIWYTHMSNNAVNGRNQEKQVRIQAEFEPKKDAMNVRIEKPTETTEFREVKTKLDAPSAHRSIARQVTDKLTGSQNPATCDLSSGKYVNTFNNKTFNYHLGQCTYLAARDCSPNGLFAVLVSGPNAPGSGNGNGIALEVRLLKNQLKFHPTSDNMDKYSVQINGQHHELTQGEAIIVESGNKAPGTPDALAYITLAGHFVHVKAPAHGVEVKYSGKDARIEVSNFWAGKMCGLCGSFDGDSKDEFQGPQGCTFAEASDFAESYIVPNNVCQNNPHNSRKICKRNDESTATYPQLEEGSASQYKSYASAAKWGNMRNYQESDSNEYDSNSRYNTYSSRNARMNSGKQCTEHTNNVIRTNNGEDSYTSRSHPGSKNYEYSSENQQYADDINYNQGHGQVCFSTETVPKCKPGCEATSHETRSVRYHCLSANDYRAKELLRRLNRNEKLDELQGKKADKTKEERVPTNCRPQN